MLKSTRMLSRTTGSYGLLVLDIDGGASEKRELRERFATLSTQASLARDSIPRPVFIPFLLPTKVYFFSVNSQPMQPRCLTVILCSSCQWKPVSDKQAMPDLDVSAGLGLLGPRCSSLP
jgi:hypothetical protein